VKALTVAAFVGCLVLVVRIARQLGAGTTASLLLGVAVLALADFGGLDADVDRARDGQVGPLCLVLIVTTSFCRSYTTSAVDDR